MAVGVSLRPHIPALQQEAGLDDRRERQMDLNGGASLLVKISLQCLELQPIIVELAKL